jgi:hypothetical protein
VNYRSIPVSHTEQEQALARLEVRALPVPFDCEGLAQALLTDLCLCRIESRNVGGGDPEVSDPELIGQCGEGSMSFLRDSFGSDANSQSRPPRRKLNYEPTPAHNACRQPSRARRSSDDPEHGCVGPQTVTCDVIHY